MKCIFLKCKCLQKKQPNTSVGFLDSLRPWYTDCGLKTAENEKETVVNLSIFDFLKGKTLF